MVKNNFSSKQHDFVSLGLGITNMLTYRNEWIKILESGDTVVVIYTDFD